MSHATECEQLVVGELEAVVVGRCFARDDPFAHQSSGGVCHVACVHGRGKVCARARKCPELIASLIVMAGTPPQAVGDVSPSPNLV